MDDVIAFFNSTDFESMLLKVSAGDVISFKNNNEWLANDPTTAIIFSDTEKYMESKQKHLFHNLC